MSNVIAGFSPLPYLADPFAAQKKVRPSRHKQRCHSLHMARSLLNTFPSFADANTQDVVISRTPSGKPYLSSAPFSPKGLPSISISHSHKWVGVLLSSPPLVCALDIEDMSISRSIEKICQGYFSKKETHFVEKNGPRGFYALWTAKEAFAKSQEQGLFVALNTYWDSYLDRFTLHTPFQAKIGDHSYRLEQAILKDDLFCTIIQKTQGDPSNLTPTLIRMIS